MQMREWKDVGKEYDGRMALYNTDPNKPWELDSLSMIGKIVFDQFSNEMCMESEQGVRTFLTPNRFVYID